MANLTFEEAQQMEASNGLSFDQAKEIEARNAPGMSFDEAKAHDEATFAGAAGTSMVQGVRQAVGGVMEATGESLRPKTLGEHVKNIASQMPTGAAGVLPALADAAKDYFRPAETPEDKQFRENLTGAGKELGDEARQKIKVATPDDLNMGQEMALSATQSVGQVLPLALAARFRLARPAFVEPVILGTFTGQQFGQTYNEAKAAGADHLDAFNAATASGTAEYMGEKLGLDTLLKRGNGWAKKFIMQEIGGEEFTTLLQAMAEKKYFNEDKWSTPGEIGHDLLVTAGAAGIGAGTITGVNKGLDFVEAKAKDAKVEGEVAKALDTMEEDIKQLQFEDTTAGQNMQQALWKNMTMQDDVDTAVLPEREEPTPAEIRQAAIVKEQKANGLDVPEVFAESTEATNRALGKMFAEGVLALPGDEASLDEGGISPEVAERRARDYQALAGKPSSWQIQHSTDENTVGLTLGQLGELPAGSVTSIGMGGESYPAHIYQGLLETYKQFMDKHLPGGRIVIVQAPFSPEHQQTAFGLHWMESTPNGFVHYIVPREMPNIGKHGYSDSLTAQSFVNSATHEFGHAIAEQALGDTLVESVGSELTDQLLREIKHGEVTNETLEQVAVKAPEEAAMIKEWASAQAKILAGELTAQEFVDRWAGVRKMGGAIAKSLDANKSLYDWAQKRAKEAGLPWEGLTALELLAQKPLARIGKRDLARVKKDTGLSEYMAEQYSRAAYSRGMVKKSSLGKLFKTTLERLRALFRDLKTYKGKAATTVIAPHETFDKWLEKLTIRGKAQAKPKGKFKLSKEIKEKQKAILARKKLAAEIKELTKEVEEKDPPPEQVEPTPEDRYAEANRSMQDVLDQALHDGFVMENSGTHAMLRGFVKRGQLEKFEEKMAEIMPHLNWDQDPKVGGVPVPKADVAGLSPEDFRKPEIIAQAVAAWKRLKFDSPFFKRWFGKSQVVDAYGEPLRIWRGSRSEPLFLDPTGRGGNTGATSAKKAFWFTDNYDNAAWYAEPGSGEMVLKPEHKRELQALRQKHQRTKDLLLSEDLSKEQRDLLMRALQKYRDQIDNMENNNGLWEKAQGHVGQYYARMENPLVIDAGRAIYTDRQWTAWIDQALAEGRDGVILKNANDPYLGTHYAIFDPNQVKAVENTGTFDPSDELHWDSDGATQVAVKPIAKMLGHFWKKNQLRMLNAKAKMIDSVMQLQQVAAGQPDEVELNAFVHLINLANQMKNKLQVMAEETGHKMVNSTPHTVNELHRVLREEWKSGVLMGDLVGLDEDGQIVWGLGVGMGPTQRPLVVNWRVQPGQRWAEFLEKQGVKPDSALGQKLTELYTDTRNTFLHQWKGLELALTEKAERLYSGNSAMLKTELWKISQLVNKYRVTPFLPQGHFGKYVILVQKKRSWEEAKEDNRRRFVTVRRMHFEDKAEHELAFTEVKELEKSGEYKVKTMVLDDSFGIPMQLPREFLDNVVATGDFTDEQVETLADVMTTGKYEKIEARFDKITEKVEGGNDDFKRVFANFTWHNSNYIWKMYYRSVFQNQISAARSAVRALERDQSIPAEELYQRVDRKRRNIKLMEQSLKYMLTPEQEYQTAKLFVTMVYLAFNIKTALMNLSTQINTYTAVTMERGEIDGHKLYAKGLYYTANVMRLTSLRDKAKTDGERRELNELIDVIDQATRQGVIDQSYAYFLAGQANSSGMLLATSNSWMGKAAHYVTEAGMYPFRVTEKMNRISTLITMYQAGRSAGLAPGLAYEEAVQKTNLLQNDYNAGNKPQLLRGKKSIFLMFASYTQFQTWIMMGGYSRASRAMAQARGETVSGYRSMQAKLWLIYALLGGLMGVPFAQNLMDVLQFVWRKFFGRMENLTDELRDFVTDLGLDANVVMHGALHNVAGFDLSGSFGMGRILPGVDLLNREYQSVDAFIGKGLTSFSGPAGNFFGNLLQALLEFGQGNVAEGAKEFPGAIGNIGKMTDALIRQSVRPDEGMGVLTKSGARLTRDLESGEFRDLSLKELVGMAMGATPTVISQNREQAFAEMGEYLYWNIRRQDLKKHYWKAVQEGDEKLREASREMINTFNEDAPDPKLRITGKELAQGVRIKQRNARELEQHGTTQKRFRGVSEEIGDSY